MIGVADASKALELIDEKGIIIGIFDLGIAKGFNLILK